MSPPMLDLDGPPLSAPQLGFEDHSEPEKDALATLDRTSSTRAKRAFSSRITEATTKGKKTIAKKDSDPSLTTERKNSISPLASVRKAFLKRGSQDLSSVSNFFFGIKIKRR